MKQVITRVDETLAESVKERAALAGESVNAFVTRLLAAAVSDRATWKREAVRAGLLLPRPRATGDQQSATGLSTPPGYAAALVATDRDDR